LGGWGKKKRSWEDGRKGVPIVTANENNLWRSRLGELSLRTREKGERAKGKDSTPNSSTSDSFFEEKRKAARKKRTAKDSEKVNLDRPNATI